MPWSTGGISEQDDFMMDALRLFSTEMAKEQERERTKAKLDEQTSSIHRTISNRGQL